MVKKIMSNDTNNFNNNNSSIPHEQIRDHSTTISQYNGEEEKVQRTSKYIRICINKYMLYNTTKTHIQLVQLSFTLCPQYSWHCSLFKVYRQMGRCGKMVRKVCFKLYISSCLCKMVGPFSKVLQHKMIKK